jgi:hypothetical protein
MLHATAPIAKDSLVVVDAHPSTILTLAVLTGLAGRLRIGDAFPIVVDALAVVARLAHRRIVRAITVRSQRLGSKRIEPEVEQPNYYEARNKDPTERVRFAHTLVPPERRLSASGKGNESFLANLSPDYNGGRKVVNKKPFVSPQG